MSLNHFKSAFFLGLFLMPASIYGALLPSIQTPPEGSSSLPPSASIDTGEAQLGSPSPSTAPRVGGKMVMQICSAKILVCYNNCPLEKGTAQSACIDRCQTREQRCQARLKTTTPPKAQIN